MAVLLRKRGFWRHGQLPECTQAGNLYVKRELNVFFFGNEVNHTNSLLLLLRNMLCSKLHHQIVDLIPFSYKIGAPELAERACKLQGICSHDGQTEDRACFLAARTEGVSMPAEGERERQHRGLVPPALRAGSKRLFQVLSWYRSSPESGDLWQRFRQFEKSAWVP